MKIYTRVVLDMTSDFAVLREESFEYDGPLVLCGGGGGGGKGGKTPTPPPPPAKPATEKDMTEATAGAVDDQQAKMKKFAGQAGSVMTSPLGAAAPAQPQKTLLGQ